MKKRKKKKKKVIPYSKKRLQRRIFFMTIIFLGTMGVMIGQVARINIKYGEEYQKQTINNMMQREEEIPAQRGAIVDRNHKTLATSVLAYNVQLSPYHILNGNLTEEKQTEIYEKLAVAAGKTAVEIREIVESRPNSQYYMLIKALDVEAAEELKGLGGVTLKKVYIRKYPKGNLTAQLLGFYNKDNKGQYGIEQYYDEYLTGIPGREFSQYQDLQFITREVQVAKDGGTIELTVDSIIQQYVATTMEKYIKEFSPINATATIMNPNTGEVYAMYSYPSFNPEKYTNLEEELGAQVWNKLSGEQQTAKLNTAWKNHVVQYAYEPGSTFKPMFVAAALEEGIIDGTEIYNCTGSHSISGQTIKCWKAGGHGIQTIEQAIANSCNVAMIEISTKMESAIFLKYIRNYGFGALTNIDLYGEVAGVLHKTLGPVEKATYSIGQGLTVTPIQLLTAFSSVINGGYLVEPYVVEQIKDYNKEIVYSHKKTVKRQVISSSTAKTVADYMKMVVESGTGVQAAVSGYNVAGKTGTAEKLPRGNDKYVISFAGFAPANNPQVVALITFDEVPEKSGAAANAFREMMENILPYLEIELSNNGQGSNGQTSEVPNVTGMSIYEAVNKLEQKELDYEIVGIGSKVTAQYPKSGVQKTKGTSVKLYTESTDLENIEEVPELIGMTVEEAKALLSGTFNVKGTGNGKIISQVPKAGTKIEKNSQVIVKTGE